MTELVEVLLVGVPLDVQRQSNAHYDALMREFTLIRQSDTAAESVPARLLDLVDELSARFDAFAEQPRALVEAALESGGTSVDLAFEVPPDITEACQRLLALLDEADAYCSAGEHLVTLSSPPAVRAYREWFLREFIRQSDGQPPKPWSAQSESPSPSSSAPTYENETPVNSETDETDETDATDATDEADETDDDRWPTTVDGDRATVMLAGELDLALAPSLRNHLNQLHTDGVRQFTLDASGISFIDSVGLSVLLALYRRCRAEGGTVSVTNPGPTIRRTLEISGLLDVLNVS